MHIDPEIILFSVALLLYLQDLAVLLFASDVAFFRSGNGAWCAKPGNRYPDFARRYLAIIRPWRPSTAVLRANWPRPLGGDPEAIAAEVAGVEQRLRFLRWQVGPLGFSIFVLLPALYIGVGPVSFLFGLAVVYLQVLLMLTTVLLQRQRLGLSRKDTALLVFESLICVPYAVSAYRKLAAKLMPAKVDPTELADALLAPADAHALRQELIAGVDLQLWLVRGDPVRTERLATYRKARLERCAA
ncbi:MAG: hypothetical protein ACREQZ_03505 [Woeseiaceae bacterium]